MQRLFYMMLIVTSVITGCHTLPQKQYAYIPPQSILDKQCAGKCMYAKKYCLRICELKNSPHCDCTTSFNTCYAACGGQVIQVKGR